ncbi:hypothetical protein ACHAXS_001350, partial [Conticribra weissflogii]
RLRCRWRRLALGIWACCGLIYNGRAKSGICFIDITLYIYHKFAWKLS